MDNAGWMPAELREILHDDLSGFVSLVGVEESQTLEFKEELTNVSGGIPDKAKEKLAVEVAAFANAAGGLVIYGIKEEKSEGSRASRAAELVGLDGLPAEVDGTVRHIIRAYVTPYPTIWVTVFESDGNQFLVIGVPPSAVAPHAVARHSDPRLRYPYRRGTEVDNWREHEVFDAYQRRLNRNFSLVDRLDSLHERVSNRIHDPLPTSTSDQSLISIFLSGVTDRSTPNNMSPNLVGRYQAELSSLSFMPGGPQFSLPVVRPIHRGVGFEREYDNGQDAALLLDGTFTAALTRTREPQDDQIVVGSNMIFSTTFNLLSIAMVHARITRAVGAITVVLGIAASSPSGEPHGLKLRDPSPIWWEERLGRPAQRMSSRSFNIDEMQNQAHLVEATSHLCSDVLSAFGIAEVPETWPEEPDCLRLAAFRGVSREIQHWAEQAEVEAR